MNITKQEANDSLAQIEDAITQTRRAIGQGTTSTILIVWGIIWVMGYSSSQFVPRMAQTLWPCLAVIGGVASWICGTRSQPQTKSANGARIGLFWVILFVYAGLWFFLLHSDNRPGQWGLHFEILSEHQAETISRQSGAFFATVPMFAYVVGGLWLGRFFVWLGATVTVLTFAGYCFLPDWFNLWMAIMGGGSLIVSGLYIRRFWSQTYGPA